MCDTVDRRISLRDVFIAYASFVWRSLRYLGVPEQDLEDMSQEVFIVVHKRLGSFAADTDLRSWLYAVCWRVSKSYHRANRNSRVKLSHRPPHLQSPATPLQSLEQRQALELGYRLLDTLDERKRAVFVLYEIEQVPMEEIARALGCPVQTAYARLHAAREQILKAARRAERTGSLP